MTDPKCHTPECTFTGPKSGATEGRCTKTAGYVSNFEINEILNGSPYLAYSDEGDIVVYNNDQWLSYLSAPTYDSRVKWIRDHNLGGVSDWSINLDRDFLEETPADGNDQGEDFVEPCDPTLNFPTLRDLDAVTEKYSRYCVGLYATKAASSELSVVLNNYTDINKGYDKMHDTYVHYVEGMIDPAILKFMDKKGLTYFKCTLKEEGKTIDMKHCLNLESLATYSTIYFNLTDPDGFFAELDKTYGVEKSWVKFGTRKWEASMPNSTTRSGEWVGYPMKADKVTIPNPKDVIAKAPEGMTDLQNMIDATYLDILFGQWDGSVADVARSVAMPVALVEQAIKSMQKVKDMAKKIKKEEQKDLIIEILSAVLVVVPFVGQIGATAAGLVTLGRVIALLGDVSNAALTIYDIVNNPESAPMAVMGLLMGATMPRTGSSFSKAGKTIRGMKAGDITSMGTVFAEKTALIKRVLREC